MRFMNWGYRSELLLHTRYAQHSELESLEPIPLCGAEINARELTHTIFLNSSVQDAQLEKILKRSFVRILYIFHEPWQMSPAYLWRAGLMPTLKAWAAHSVTVPALRISDLVVLPSRYAMDVYCV